MRIAGNSGCNYLRKVLMVVRKDSFNKKTYPIKYIKNLSFKPVKLPQWNYNKRHHFYRSTLLNMVPILFHKINEQTYKYTAHKPKQNSNKLTFIP
jgi:hypothetical protein